MRLRTAPDRTSVTHPSSDIASAIQPAPQGAWLTVHIVPRSSTFALAAVRSGALVVRVPAPPVEGAANEALVTFLARVLEVPRNAIAIRSGAKGRRKRLLIGGVSPDNLLERLCSQ